MSKQSKRMKIVRQRIKDKEFDEDEEGRAIVTINITDADTLLSTYNDDGKEIISEETATFINNVTKPIPPRQDIHLMIACDSYTSSKEEVYKNAIINYYQHEFAHRENKLRNNSIISMMLLFLGIVFFTALYFVGRWNDEHVFYLLLEVVSWVFAWEAVDQLVLQRNMIRFMQKKELQIIFAKITFKKLK